MKMKTGNIFFIANLTACFLMLLSLGCSKEESKPDDKQAPTVEIITPIADAIYARGNFLTLQATFADNEGLKNCIAIIDYIDEIADSPGLKSVRFPWKPALDGVEYTIDLNGSNELHVNENLFGDAIDFDCLEGAYILHLSIEDINGNTAQEDIEIFIQ
ncbi:DUF4625 domain-containing protein [Carboxylicivirga sp. M1479]|uniref:DUF4625 domain-containing protein n=1 Tax=Carboxylicivirga sp. M1479 TaxID=2594476 RepID=UPI001178AF46|nr:DUF4625 domain-containing protein [Carboxylicivirga sp. M1479]TRX70346.1 DUF4625 domain-containing protein [Carboxylicivirga sp. M1479]